MVSIRIILTETLILRPLPQLLILFQISTRTLPYQNDFCRMILCIRSACAMAQWLYVCLVRVLHEDS